MKAGIKVGPLDGIEILKKTKAEYCEIWFRLDWYKKYTPLFDYCRRNNINFGLHFWAMTSDGFFPSLLNLNNKTVNETYTLIKQTIRIAGRINAKYVCFHPESYRSVLLDLNKKKIRVINPNSLLNRKKSFNQLIYLLEKIRDYGLKKRVTPFIETVPKYMPADFSNLQKSGIKLEKSEGLETEKFFQLAEMGFPICLDFGHTLAQLVTEDRKKLFNYLYLAAKKMKKTIGLIHVTTNKPPFIGVDSHHGILGEDFKKKVIPNRKQLIQLLSLFVDKDVWLIPEPAIEKMIANHFELKKIVEEIKRN